IDPAAPATVYAGGSGVSKSINGGTSWTATGLAHSGVHALAIDPVTPTTVYAGTDYLGDFKGVFKSVDGGGTWTAVNIGLPTTSSFNALAVDPHTPTTVYAGAYPGKV